MDLKGYSIESKKFQLMRARIKTKDQENEELDQRREAALKVCSVAESVEEARTLLDMLGLLDPALRAAQ
jgi:hypothetical protein